jgi:hypothetical protein
VVASMGAAVGASMGAAVGVSMGASGVSIAVHTILILASAKSNVNLCPRSTKITDIYRAMLSVG